MIIKYFKSEFDKQNFNSAENRFHRKDQNITQDVFGFKEYNIFHLQVLKQVPLQSTTIFIDCK